MNEHPVWNYIDQNTERFLTLADNIWNTPETCYAEKSSVEFHRNELSYQGFKISESVAGIPTAIMGEAGSGGPVIAILGEFDGRIKPSR